MTRRTLILHLTLALALALTLAGCSSNGSKTSGDVPGSSAGTDDGPMPLTAAGVEAMLEGDLASEAWAASVTGVGEETYLRRPVVSIGFKDTTALTEAQMPLQDAFLDEPVWGVIELLSPDFTAFITIGNTGDFPAEEIPAAPATAPELAGWFDAAFGSGSPLPEAWVASVKSTEFAASTTAGYSDVLVVNTDLPYDPEGKRKAEVIHHAIATAAPTYAKTFDIRFADGNSLMGEIVPGIAAFGY